MALADHWTSLQATWIRNTILRAMREYSPAAAKRLHMSVVFQAPSISALTDAILRAMNGEKNVKICTYGTTDFLFF